MISNSAPTFEALAGEPTTKSPMRGADATGAESSVQSDNPASILGFVTGIGIEGVAQFGRATLAAATDIAPRQSRPRLAGGRG
jgi:hypothetical protein